MKSGYKTTEFWLTLLAQALPILVLTGVLTPHEADVVRGVAGDAITTGFAFGGALIALAVYIYGRAQVKAAELKG